ncbi:MAG: serine/threonine-protein kinase [Bdellovibrionota bacterium]
MTEHTNIGEYEITSQLGAGGVSKVYKAKKQGAFGFSKNFAIKVLLSRSEEERSQFQPSFVSEAKVLSFFNHPNIVQVYELNANQEEIFVVMDYIEGATLSQLLEKNQGPFPIEVALCLTQEILNALQFMQHHDLGGKKLTIVHGDISLQNIMVQNKTFIAKLNDFGFSRAVEFGKSARVQPPVIGNPYYISPEHMRCEWIDHRSDIYSLGIVLYDLLFNERLFHYDLDEIKNLARRGQTINRDNYVKLPFEVSKIISKMTALNPDVRYQNPDEALFDIENYLAKIQSVCSVRRLKTEFLLKFATAI